MAPSAEWQTIELPKWSKPVSNRHGMFLVLNEAQYTKYRPWKLYQRHDGAMWLYFGSGIKRRADEVLPGHQVLVFSYK